MTVLVSVIIPTHNKAARLRLTLTALLDQDIGRSNFEVVIAADGCTDATAAEVQAFERDLTIRYLESPQLGQSGARNLAARSAIGQILTFIDDDVLLSPNYLRCGSEIVRDDANCVARARVYTLRYARPFKDPERGLLFDSTRALASGSPLRKMLISSEQIRTQWTALAARGTHLGHFEATIDEIMCCGPAALRWVGYSGSGVLIDRQLFWRMGGYDQEFGLNWGAEALELGYRLGRAGASFAQCDEVRSLHLDHPRSAAIATFEASFAKFYARHQDQDILKVKALIEPGLVGLQ